MTLRNIKPEYSRTRVNKAGKNIRNGMAMSDDILVIENWRAAHNKILNDWQSTLRGRCKGKNIIFAQRLKRRSTIFDQLTRHPNMQLATMHDIAGCRLIFDKLQELYEYRDNLHKSWMKHILRKEDENPYPYNYILSPHPDNSGYRGIHDVYQYCARSGRDESWNELLVEIQYRTKAQHAWATANEIAGSMTGNHSKFGQGDECQKEFFRLASEIIARSEENMKSCYPSMTNQELVSCFQNVESKTKLLQRLKSLKIMSENVDKFNINKQNVILVYGDKSKTLDVYFFDTLPNAQNKYFELEKELDSSYDIVLVRTPTQDSLRQAYKNYFSDTRDFTRLISAGLKKLHK